MLHTSHYILSKYPYAALNSADLSQSCVSTLKINDMLLANIFPVHETANTNSGNYSGQPAPLSQKWTQFTGHKNSLHLTFELWHEPRNIGTLQEISCDPVVTVAWLYQKCEADGINQTRRFLHEAACSCALAWANQVRGIYNIPPAHVISGAWYTSCLWQCLKPPEALERAICELPTNGPQFC